jgi:cytidylate kinase
LSKKIVIAIDGFSSTGKSTMAKELARLLEYKYVDTGAMYRAVALYALRKNLFKDDLHKNLVAGLNDIKLSFEFNPKTQKSEIHLNGENVEEEIRGMEVSGKVSEVAQIHEVRKKLVAEQQEMGRSSGIVMDGRDIGTVVFPNAELKIFMTAREEIRVDRRYQELSAKGKDISREEIAKNIAKRDFQDMDRSDSPLKQATDAKVLDNSDINQKEQLEMALAWVKDLI